jgi:glucose-6-phosphate 1-dehydrogenase
MAETPLADVLVLFGATGDLAQRMLLPSLYFLDADGFLPEGLKVLATARTEQTREAFVETARGAIAERAAPEALDERTWRRFSERLDYASANAAEPNGLEPLRAPRAAPRRPIF